MRGSGSSFGWFVIVASTLGVAASLAGCRVIAPGRPHFEELEAEVKSFPVPEGRALVYLFRDQPIAPTFRIGISLDGEVVGALDTRTFIVCTVEPGTHEIATIEEEPTTLQIETVAGGLNFVRHEYGDLAFGEDTRFEEVTAAVGREAVEDMHVIPSSCYRRST